MLYLTALRTHADAERPAVPSRPRLTASERRVMADAIMVVLTHRPPETTMA